MDGLNKEKGKALLYLKETGEPIFWMQSDIAPSLRREESVQEAVERLISTDEHPWMDSRIIYFVRSGSRAYGTATEDSDHDFKAVFIPWKEDYLGLSNRSKEIPKTTNKDGKNTRDDVDVQLIPINKFVDGLLKGIPSYIEMLYVNDDDVLFMNEYGKEFRLRRDNYLSRNMIPKYRGFAKAQAKSLYMDGDSYDTKQFMNAVRLLRVLRDTLLGDTPNTYREDNGFLRELRNGAMNKSEARSFFEGVDRGVGELIDAESNLQDKPDSDKEEEFMVSLIVKYLKSTGEI